MSIHNTQVYATLSRVSIRGITFTHHHTVYYSTHADRSPSKKENFQKDRPVLDNVPVNSKSTVEFSAGVKQ